MFWDPSKTQHTAATSQEAREAVKFSDPRGLSGSLVWNTRYLEVTQAGGTWTPNKAVVTGLLRRWDCGQEPFSSGVSNICSRGSNTSVHQKYSSRYKTFCRDLLFGCNTMSAGGDQQTHLRRPTNGSFPLLADIHPATLLRIWQPRIGSPPYAPASFRPQHKQTRAFVSECTNFSQPAR